MSGPFEELAALDRLVHEPARLALLTALSECASADFLFLLSLTGLTKGNLSSHLARLEEGGLVRVERTLPPGGRGRTPTTRVSLTPSGRRAVERHWERLERLRTSARRWGVQRA